MEPPLVNNAIRIMSTIDSLLDIITVSSSTEMDQRKLDFTLTWLLSALLNKSVFQQVMLVCIKFRFVCCPQMAGCRWSLFINGGFLDRKRLFSHKKTLYYIVCWIKIARITVPADKCGFAL